jgi:hypothetical protein
MSIQPRKWNSAKDEGDRRRAEAVVETLAAVRNPGENLAELAHDVRNMVTALVLYCDLLEEPGVLTSSFRHYGSELRLVASASRRLVEKLVLLGARETAISCSRRPEVPLPRSSAAGEYLLGDIPNHPSDRLPGDPISDLNQELMVNRTLLTAMAGPAIALTVKAEWGCSARKTYWRRSDSGYGQSGEECRRGHARGRPSGHQAVRIAQHRGQS